MVKIKEKISFADTCKVLVKALGVSLKIKSPLSIIISILGFAAAFFPILIAKSLRKFTDLIVELYGKGMSNVSKVLAVFMILASLYILQALYVFVRNYVNAYDTLRIQEYIKEVIIRITCRIKYKYIENYDSYREKINFSETVTGRRVAGSIQAIETWIQSLIAFISILNELVSVNIWIAISLIVTCIPAIILSYTQKDEEYRFKTKWMKEGAMVIHYYGMCCAPDSMNDLRHWNIYDFIKSGWRRVAEDYIKKKNDITKKHVLYNSIADILRNSVFIIILLLVANEIFKNPGIGLGTYMLVYTLAGDFQKVTANVFVTATVFMQDIKYMRDFFEMQNYEQEEMNENSNLLECFDIIFQNVYFTYPNSTRKALNNINVHIKQGEKVAIVGQNGSGKTTFANLLCGLLEPDSGQIKIGGKSFKKDMASIRKSISIAFQDFSRYEASIRENITISDPRKIANDGELEAICVKTGVDEIVKSQPKGFDELIGIFSEHGKNLSGGQWQRIALARAAYRDDAGIMVLDEPTAALDPVSEAKLYKEFTELTGDKTTLLISHRLGICSIVDRILVFKDGSIIEDGNHESLMKKNGYYAKMYKSQAQWYS